MPHPAEVAAAGSWRTHDSRKNHGDSTLCLCHDLQNSLASFFVDCMISRNREVLRAPAEEGHLSFGLTHLLNTFYRIVRTLNFGTDTQLVKNDEEAYLLLREGNSGYWTPFAVPE